MKNLGGQFELESGGHFKLEIDGQYHWNLQNSEAAKLLFAFFDDTIYYKQEEEMLI